MKYWEVIFLGSILWLLSFLNCAFTQTYHRVGADLTVKTKMASGDQNLTKGKVFYDKNYKELIYRLSFPQYEEWVIRNGSIIKIKDETIYFEESSSTLNEFTIFHLALNSNLTNYGLQNSGFKIRKVEKKEDLVLSYWTLPDVPNDLMSYIVVAKRDGRLDSVVIYAQDNKLSSRQFFRDYIQIGTFEFPRKVIQIMYDKNGNENHQLTEFENIKVNDMTNDELYKFLRHE